VSKHHRIPLKITKHVLKIERVIPYVKGGRQAPTGDRIEMCNEELHTFYISPNIRMMKLRRIRLARHVAHMETKTNSYKVLVEEHEGKRPLGRSRRRCEDDIKTDLKGIG
jgi:hypothetical protein